MKNRFKDALLASEGACNPSAIALGIVSACREIRENGGDTSAIINDPAVKLMVHQLSFICRVPEFDADLDAYGRALDSCREACGHDTGHRKSPLEGDREPEAPTFPAP